MQRPTWAIILTLVVIAATGAIFYAINASWLVTILLGGAIMLVTNGVIWLIVKRRSVSDS